MNGFQLSFINALTEVGSYHLQITNNDNCVTKDALTKNKSVLDAILLNDKDLLNDLSCTIPFYETQSLLLAGSFNTAAILRTLPSDVYNIDKEFAKELNIIVGDFDISRDNFIILGDALAASLNVTVGGTITAFIITDDANNSILDNSREFIVKGIFSTGYYVLNEGYAFLGMGDLDKVNNSVTPNKWGGANIHYGLKLFNKNKTQKFANELRNCLKNVANKKVINNTIHSDTNTKVKIHLNKRASNNYRDIKNDRVAIGSYFSNIIVKNIFNTGYIKNAGCKGEYIINENRKYFGNIIDKAACNNKGHSCKVGNYVNALTNNIAVGNKKKTRYYFADVADAANLTNKIDLNNKIDHGTSSTKKINEQVGVVACGTRGDYDVKTYIDMNRAYFGALATEKTVLMVIMLLIVAVVAANIYNSTRRAIIEKTCDIAILISFGATKGEVQKIFVLRTFITTIIAVAVGVILGVISCYNMDKIFLFLGRATYLAQYVSTWIFDRGNISYVTENEMFEVYSKISAVIKPFEVAIFALFCTVCPTICAAVATRKIFYTNVLEALAHE